MFEFQIRHEHSETATQYSGINEIYFGSVVSNIPKYQRLCSAITSDHQVPTQHYGIRLE